MALANQQTNIEHRGTSIGASMGKMPFPVISTLLLALTFTGMMTSIWMIFLYAPTDAIEGDAQRIFYFHLPSAIIGMLAFGIVTIGGIGYLGLGGSPKIWMACGAVALAHSGASMLWVFSSTLLQLGTVDRLRGRVFSAEFALSVLTMALSSYAAGVLIDSKVPVRYVAGVTGLVVLIPALLWAWALKTWPGGADIVAAGRGPEPDSTAAPPC